MKRFARMIGAIDDSNGSDEKVRALVRYFNEAPSESSSEDLAWAIKLLVGRRPKRFIQSNLMRRIAEEYSGLPSWLFDKCNEMVGDLAETIALIMPDPADPSSQSLGWWVRNRMLPLAKLPEREQSQLLSEAWASLNRPERLLFNKLVTGAFRSGVTESQVIAALSEVHAIPRSLLSHRLSDDWTPSAESYVGLIAPESAESSLSRPYPLAYPCDLEAEPEALGDISDWQIEWKWDGMRCQGIRRGGISTMWSLTEESIGHRFPEILWALNKLPDGTVVDGEIVAWNGDLPAPSSLLQQLPPKKGQEVQAAMIVFDILECGGVDVRMKPLRERRALLERLAQIHLATGLFRGLNHKGVEVLGSHLMLAAAVHGNDWESLERLRAESRGLGVEGLVLKRLDSPYVPGAKEEKWLSWKRDPHYALAILIYAQLGSGKQASEFTEYTLGAWQEGALVPIAKLSTALPAEEIALIDEFIRTNTLERFGPVRTVTPELVMEIAFDAVLPSTRHKAGLTLRNAKVIRWRRDLGPEHAANLENLRTLEIHSGG